MIRWLSRRCLAWLVIEITTLPLRCCVQVHKVLLRWILRDASWCKFWLFFTHYNRAGWTHERRQHRQFLIARDRSELLFVFLARARLFARSWLQWSEDVAFAQVDALHWGIDSWWIRDKQIIEFEELSFAWINRVKHCWLPFVKSYIFHSLLRLEPIVHKEVRWRHASRDAIYKACRCHSIYARINGLLGRFIDHLSSIKRWQIAFMMTSFDHWRLAQGQWNRMIFVSWNTGTANAWLVDCLGDFRQHATIYFQIVHKWACLSHCNTGMK